MRAERERLSAMQRGAGSLAVLLAAMALSCAQAVIPSDTAVERGPACAGRWSQILDLSAGREALLADVSVASDCSLAATIERLDLLPKGAAWVAARHLLPGSDCADALEELGPVSPLPQQAVPFHPDFDWSQIAQLLLRDSETNKILARFSPPVSSSMDSGGARRQLLAQNHKLTWTFPSLINLADTSRYPNLNVAVGDTVTFTWPQDSTSPHGVYQIPTGECPAGDNYAGQGFVQLAPIENAGSAQWTASAPGTYYFACQESGHCDGGMIITVIVGGGPSEAPGPAPSQAPAGAASVPSPAPASTGSASAPRSATAVSSTPSGSGQSSAAQAPASGASGCGLSLAGQTQAFTSCQVLSTSAAQFNLLWTLQAPTAAGQSVLNMAMDVPSNGGWVAVGFPTTPGEMLGASAVILKTDAAAATGASGDQYYLAAQSTSGVQPPGRLNITDITAANSNGQLQGTWTLTLPSAQVAAATPLIFAAGSLGTGGSLAYHGQSKSDGEINFATGLAAQTSSGSTHMDHILWAHGWVAVIGLGFLIPLGIVTAKLFRGSSAWNIMFWVHIVLQGLGVLMGFVVAGLGAQLEIDNHKQHVHRSIGITVITAFGLQAILAMLWRPDPAHKHRWLFQLQHWYLGRFAACLAIANVYLGLNIVQPTHKHAYQIAYSVVIGLLFLAWLVKGLISWRREPLLLPRPTKSSKQFLHKDANGSINGTANGGYSGMHA